jgi:hypothetical protein
LTSSRNPLCSARTRAARRGFLIVAVAALVCAATTAFFLAGESERRAEVAMVEQGGDAVTA